MSVRSLAAALVALAPAYVLAVEIDRGGTPVDTTAPVIVHTAIDGARRAGQAVAIEATVTDASAVYVVLHYRVEGAASFESVPMARSEGSHAATIPGSSVVVPGIEYYIWAADTSFFVNTTSAPAGAPAVLHGFDVTAAAPDDAAVEPDTGCGTGGRGAWSLVSLWLVALRRRSRRLPAD